LAAAKKANAAALAKYLAVLAGRPATPRPQSAFALGHLKWWWYDYNVQMASDEYMKANEEMNKVIERERKK